MDEELYHNEDRVKNLTVFFTFFMNVFDKHFVKKTSAFSNDHFLTDEELSSVLKIDRRTLIRYRKSGKIPYYKIHGKILYKESQIFELLENNYHPAFKHE